ncbi:MAG TPA: hypothetical protein VKU40_15195 [Thermoanaerobaculia bacterium]|nr:hypothetical protein [Thermoanaerobaculia bacterium]
MRVLGHFFARPFLDLYRGLGHCLNRPVDLLPIALGLLAGWWLYVPLHELLHAAGCWLAGGRVETLEISPLYGGTLLAAVFPFVEAGGEYAGRLAAFDTGGSAWVHLAAVVFPFLLTVWPGVWALRHAARRRSGFLFAFLLPLAMAPIVSLSGDAYEVGSLAVTALPAWSSPAERAALVGDDLVLRLGAVEQAAPALGGELWAGFASAVVLGLLWALATYAVGSLIASALSQRPLRAQTVVLEGEETVY